MNREPSGDKVYIEVVGQDGKNIDGTIFGKVVQDEAVTWLAARGYRIVKEKKQAHSTIVFSAVQETKQVYVPGQTYSVPIYNGNYGTTTTVKNSLGQTIGSLESQPSNPLAPTGYQTHYREGYTATFQNRWLLVGVWRSERGSPPEMVSEGQVYPKQRHQEFFENHLVVREATQKLLAGTVLGMTQRAPASVSHEVPGCWPRLGLKFRNDKKLEHGVEIEDFAEGSNAPKAGLKKGDVVLKIANEEQPSNVILQVLEGQVLPITFLRKGKRMKTKVPTAMFCLGE